MRTSLLLSVAVALALCATGLRADSPSSEQLETARKLFAEAERDQRAGHWVEALRKLLDVASIKETAGVRFHIASCQEQLGKLLDALESFRRAHRLAQGNRVDDVLQLVAPRIEGLRARVPTLTIRIQPRENIGAVTVMVDGTRMNQTRIGMPVDVDPGEHDVEVRGAEGAVLRRTVTLSAGKSGVVDFDLASAPRPRPVQSPAAPVSREAGSGGSAPAVPAPAWVLFGAGAALGVGGILAYEKADAVANDSVEACARSLACDPSRRSTVRAYDSLALGMWIGAAAAVGAGFVWTLSFRPAQSHPVSIRVRPGELNLGTSF